MKIENEIIPATTPNIKFCFFKLWDALFAKLWGSFKEAAINQKTPKVGTNQLWVTRETKNSRVTENLCVAIPHHEQ